MATDSVAAVNVPRPDAAAEPDAVAVTLAESAAVAVTLALAEPESITRTQPVTGTQSIEQPGTVRHGGARTVGLGRTVTRAGVRADARGRLLTARSERYPLCGATESTVDGARRRAGRARTFCGHQNQRPISAAIDGVMNDRITSVSTSRPSPMVVPT
ncbi:hypothetical protein MCHUDSM44219_05484 [Mycolicibacterium chubuense]|uniref:Uncharacterized protein n=1 Tax=Mycolicibacterium chubuense TaxID=1800 RepID=A0A0J6VJR0_MYCCU|nr:hypothetical protein MCHUDSM44219_05484 [Mycolicibacterium chubuense]